MRDLLVPDPRTAQKVNDMLRELEDHLREAAGDGKPPEAVVGEDVRAFAESWAEVNRPPGALAKRLLVFAEMLVFMTASLAALAHLLHFSLSFPVDASVLSVVSFYVAFGSRFFSPLVDALDLVRPRRKRYLITLALMLATMFAPYGILLVVFGNALVVAFYWPWPATLVLVLAAFVLGRVRKRLVPNPRALGLPRF